MITIEYCDMLTKKRGILVHGINCRGFMGAGIAAQVRKRWPQVFDKYKAHCADFKPHLSRRAALLGTVQWCKIDATLWLVNAFTQFDPGPNASYDAIASCFARIAGESLCLTNLPLYFPAIGCGIGGLKWPIVERIIDEQYNQGEKTLCLLP